MEIEIGEYVRTKKGEIAKIIDIVKPINANILLFDVNLKEIWLNEVGLNINKHSKDITNLIEKDDYVNGYKVIEVTNHTFTTLEHGGNKVHHKECVTIKSVVTKEAYKNIEYRLED